jgi:hypothetical protein
MIVTGTPCGTDRAFPAAMRWFPLFASFALLAASPALASPLPAPDAAAEPDQEVEELVEPEVEEVDPSRVAAAAAPPESPLLVDAVADDGVDFEEGFAFGSYGRVVVGSDMRGSTPEAVNVVRHGSRIVEPTYLELDMYYRLRAQHGVRLTTVTTLAFGDQLFHLTGEFDAQVAVRNFYLKAEKGPFGLWAGSRMYRGDDIYLLDFWPLDHVNTVGGGATYTEGRLDAGVHVGLNRLLDPFQFQERSVLTPGFGADTIPELDRQRYIASAKSSYRVWGEPQGPAVKVKVYGEVQALPQGTRRREDDTIEELPSDFGWTAGAQVGTWGWVPGTTTHANLFMRYSRGLNAFDELAPPMGLNRDRKAYPEANELLLGLSGSYDFKLGGAMVGGYVRRFEDASPGSQNYGDGWEYIIATRPRVHVWQGVEGAVDLSYQVRFPRALSPNSLMAMDPAVVQVAPMVLYSPFGPGAYARPQFRLVYRAAHLNEGARDLYPFDDPRRARPWVHFLGVQAEWWFNSTYR